MTECTGQGARPWDAAAGPGGRASRTVRAATDRTGCIPGPPGTIEGVPTGAATEPPTGAATEPPTVTATEPPTGAAVEPPTGVDALALAGFSFSYPGCAPVFDGVGWRVPSGAFALLTGATGSGKTTLLRCCKPEIAPAGERAGAVSVLGRPLCEWGAAESAAGIGYVAQSPENQMVCDSVWHELAFGLENLGVPQGEMRRRVAEVAHFFGIGPWVRRRTPELSGGQKQLVNLAAVLVMQPRLLLLDEPTAQLDPVAEKGFLHALFRINRELGITVVVATHAPESMADYATCCFHLGKGGLAKVALERYRGTGAFTGHAEEEGMPPRPQDRIAPGGILGGGRPSSGQGSGLSPNPNTASGQGSNPNTASGQGSNPNQNPNPNTNPNLRPNTASGPGSNRNQAFEFPFCAARGGGGIAIELRDVRFRYERAGEWVLRGCDLAVRCGEVHAVVGGNGCGKSTLLRLAACVLKPERGRVRNALLGRQALLPQDPKALFVCDTVHEELHEWQGSCGYADATVQKTVARFGLSGLESRHPYDLSGGQQQKLALAKLLLTEPGLLLLDEPTKGLDAPSKLEIADILAGYVAEGATVLMATHDLAFASAVAGTVSMLFDGETACSQPAAEFFAGNLFYRPAPDGFLRQLAARGGSGGEGRGGLGAAAGDPGPAAAGADVAGSPGLTDEGAAGSCPGGSGAAAGGPDLAAAGATGDEPEAAR